MKQLVQLQKVYDQFEARETVVIAVAQEDSDLEKHGKMLNKLDGTPRFHVVADLGRKDTPRYHRTSAYLIDKHGLVRQVFPMMIHHRARWAPIIEEVDRMRAAD